MHRDGVWNCHLAKDIGCAQGSLLRAGTARGDGRASHINFRLHGCLLSVLHGNERNRQDSLYSVIDGNL